MPYRFLGDVAIAEVAFEARGKTLVDMFKAAALALTNTQVRNVKSVEKRVSVDMYIEAENLEMLLFDFLQELVFLKDTEQLLLIDFDIRISEQNNRWNVKGNVWGEMIDTKRHEMAVGVKGVSLHYFEVVESEDGWEAMVVVDV